MATTITSITGNITPGSVIVIEGTELDAVTDVLLHSPSGNTIEPQVVNAQSPGTINATLVIGNLPYNTLALDLVTPGGSVTEPVVMEPWSLFDVVEITSVDAGAVISDPIADFNIEVGDQVVVVGGTGTVGPDGTVDGTVQVAIWDETTELYSDLMWITGGGGEVVMGQSFPLLGGRNNINLRAYRDINLTIGE